MPIYWLCGTVGFSIQVTRDYKLEVNWDSKLEAMACVLHNTTHCRVGAAGGLRITLWTDAQGAVNPSHGFKTHAQVLDLSAQGHGPYI